MFTVPFLSGKAEYITSIKVDSIFDNGKIILYTIIIVIVDGTRTRQNMEENNEANNCG